MKKLYTLVMVEWDNHAQRTPLRVYPSKDLAEKDLAIHRAGLHRGELEYLSYEIGVIDLVENVGDIDHYLYTCLEAQAYLLSDEFEDVQFTRARDVKLVEVGN